jgi:flagellar basal-body rod modification protein FlgD
MIDTNNTIGSTSSAAAGASNRTTMGKNEFMKLLLTQLQYQNPLNPLEPQEFAAQLAAFSNVEQLSQLNTQLTAQTQSIELSTIMTKAAFSSSLVGRSVVASGDKVSIPDSGQGAIRVEVGQGGGSATLELRDSTGRVVARRDLGVIEGGKQTLALPGDLPSGTYTYSLEVKTAEGAAVDVATYSVGTVDGVLFRDGQIILEIDGMELSLDDVVEIGPSKDPSQPLASLKGLLAQEVEMKS